ncbi:MAG: ThiF family adenylyltransferase, partial [Oscillospiraceae bacterium]
MDFLKRQNVLLGDDLSNYISNKKVVVIGLGGVGGASLESIVRCGVKNIMVWDNDIIDITNLNRQIIALKSNIGDKKVDVAKLRAEMINIGVNIIKIDDTYSKDKNHILLDYKPDFV